MARLDDLERDLANAHERRSEARSSFERETDPGRKEHYRGEMIRWHNRMSDLARDIEDERRRQKEGDGKSGW